MKFGYPIVKLAKLCAPLPPQNGKMCIDLTLYLDIQSNVAYDPL